jgi:O-acetyl-ADP-ribose deacetylase (regulator of RNase III)
MFKLYSTEISLACGDITVQHVDVVVNAANSGLLGGGGVDGAIHRAGGPGILEECKVIREEHGKCEAGNAVVTTAGTMPAKRVVHTVGPVWRGGQSGEAETLKSCYENSLELASKGGYRSIAFPAISTGVYGYPIERAARIAVKTVFDWVKKHRHFREVRFVLFSERDYEIYQEIVGEMLSSVVGSENVEN